MQEQQDLLHRCGMHRVDGMLWLKKMRQKPLGGEINSEFKES